MVKKLLCLVIIGLVFSGCAEKVENMSFAKLHTRCNKYNLAKECYELANSYDSGKFDYRGHFNKYNVIAKYYDFACKKSVLEACSKIEYAKEQIATFKPEQKQIRENIEGFRDIKLGDPVEKLGKYEIISQQDNFFVSARKTDENLTIGKTKIKNMGITYDFFDNMLYEISIGVETEKDFMIIIDAFEAKYGKFAIEDVFMIVEQLTGWKIIDKENTIEGVLPDNCHFGGGYCRGTFKITNKNIKSKYLDYVNRNNEAYKKWKEESKRIIITNKKPISTITNGNAP